MSDQISVQFTRFSAFYSPLIAPPPAANDR